jgi:hypothetical protein
MIVSAGIVEVPFGVNPDNPNGAVAVQTNVAPDTFELNVTAVDVAAEQIV